MKIYQALSRKFNYVNKGDINPYMEQAVEHIEEIMEKHFPSGSGFDSGCEFDFDKSKPERLVIKVPYHCMDEHGYYDSWVYTELIITPDLSYGYNMKINWKGYNGKYKSLLDDYFADVFSQTLENECKYPTFETKEED